MQCVSCKEPMLVLEADGVEIDFCLDCGGTWLDAGELEILTDDPERAAQILEETQKEGGHGKAGRKCPICRKRMDILLIGPEKKLEIDECPKRHGLWFDRGELEALLTFFDEHKHKRVAALLRKIFVSSPPHTSKG